MNGLRRVDRPQVSLVVPMHNEAQNIEMLYARVSVVMDSLEPPLRWELLCINDGSSDDTLARLVALRERDRRVRVIDLSRNFGKEAALSAGLDHAAGEAVIPMDADLQDPPELIPLLIDKWRQGYDVVNACRASRAQDSWAKRTGAGMFYWLINRVSDVEIPANVGDFRLISRNALHALLSLPERRRFMKGLFAWVGFPTATVHYSRPSRHAGRSQWGLSGLLRLALEGLTSFGQVPLQLVSYAGLIVSGAAFTYGCYILTRTLVYGNSVAGYPSLMVTLLFLGGVQLLGLGVIGEYLGRVYDESKQRPLYIVRRIWDTHIEDTCRITAVSEEPQDNARSI